VAIDHPHPWNEFQTLPDERQALLWREMKSISEEAGAFLLLRSYSHERSRLGLHTEKILREICKQSHP
jgi:hypothetical protein